MRYKSYYFSLTITMLAVMSTFFAACDGSKPESNDASQLPVVAADSMDRFVSGEDNSFSVRAPFDSDVPMILDEPDDAMPATVKDKPESAPKSTPKKAENSKTQRGGKQTIYISTYGANGKVWGHVTMNGNTGRGTIHDDDENSYSITVSRHGNELYGTDQNGRQYVFRL